MDKQEKLDEVLHAKLTLETARLAWKELERFFASGALISVSRDLDLVDVAVRFANDDKAAVTQWLTDGRVTKVTDVQALAWHEADIVLWTVVVKPWILVQEDYSSTH
jgi:hypothetical protein